jgi:hypothetical protein
MFMMPSVSRSPGGGAREHHQWQPQLERIMTPAALLQGEDEQPLPPVAAPAHCTLPLLPAVTTVATRLAGDCHAIPAKTTPSPPSRWTPFSSAAHRMALLLLLLL